MSHFGRSRETFKFTLLSIFAAFPASFELTEAVYARKLTCLSMNLLHQVALLFILAIPIACISWTVTHEDVFREPRVFFIIKSKRGKNILIRKFFYLLTCEYCFSHWVTLGALLITNYQLVYDDWRGYLIGGFSLVWIANVYMTLFKRMRIDIKKDKTEIEVEEELLGKK